MNKKIKEFKNKYPDYTIINFTNNYNAFYYLDEKGFLHRKDNIYRAIKFKTGIESAINKVTYIQEKLNQLEEDYILIYYGGMKGKSIVLLNNHTYSVNLFDLLSGHDVSNITCIDPIKSEVSKSRKCGFSRTKFYSLYKNKKVMFYLLEIYNGEESFYKVGLTCKKINQRFCGLNTYNYKYKIVDTFLVKGEEAYDIEKEFKKQAKEYKYIPKIKYPGYTESFNKKIKIIYEQFKTKRTEID